MPHLPTPVRQVIGLALFLCLTLTLTPSASHADPLHDAVAALDAPNHADSHDRAFQQLAELHTAEALREIARHFSLLSGESDFKVVRMLRQPENLPFVLQEMERQLAEPDHPVTYTVLFFLISYSLEEQNPHPRVDPQKPLSPETVAANEEHHRKKQEHNWAILQKVDQLWPRMPAQAQTTAILALYQVMDNTGPGFTIFTLPYTQKEFVALRNRLAQEIAQRFDQLPTDTVITLLQNHEKVFSHPSLLPTLIRLYNDPANFGNRPSDYIYTLLLRRIHALASEEARKLLLRDLRKGSARFGARALDLLPPEQAPEMDDVIVHFLASGDRTLGHKLLNRYGSPKLAPLIRETYLPKLTPYQYDEEASYLAFLLKVDPGKTEEQVEKAFQSLKAGSYQSRTFLYRVMTRSGADLPPFQYRFLTKLLNGADLNQAADAASLLDSRGGLAAKDILWQRLERFHNENAGQPEKPDRQTSNPSDDPTRNLESRLIQALTGSPLWILDKAESERLDKLRVHEPKIIFTPSWIDPTDDGPIPIVVVPGANDNWPSLDPSTVNGSINGIITRNTSDNWFVANYCYFTREEMLRKITQYPRQTIFSFEFQGTIATEDIQATYEALRRDLEPLGMSLIKAPLKKP